MAAAKGRTGGPNRSDWMDMRDGLRGATSLELAQCDNRSSVTERCASEGGVCGQWRARRRMSDSRPRRPSPSFRVSARAPTAQRRSACQLFSTRTAAALREWAADSPTSMGCAAAVRTDRRDPAAAAATALPSLRAAHAGGRRTTQRRHTRTNDPPTAPTD